MELGTAGGCRGHISVLTNSGMNNSRDHTWPYFTYCLQCQNLPVFVKYRETTDNFFYLLGDAHFDMGARKILRSSPPLDDVHLQDRLPNANHAVDEDAIPEGSSVSAE